MTAVEPPQPDELFVKAPLKLMDMVADGDLSRDAAWLFLVLARHINRRSGHTKVWPSREKLAAAMGLKQPRGVDRYLAELEKAGLITITEQWAGGMQRPNVYTVHMPSSGSSAPQRTAERPVKTQIPADRQGVRSSAQRYAPQRTEGVRSSAHELDELELDEKPSPPSPPSAAGPSGSRPERGEGKEASREDQNLEALVAEIGALRPDFSTRSIRGALEQSYGDGRARELIPHAARRCYADPATYSPGRLNHDGSWWAQALSDAGRAQPQPAADMASAERSAYDRARTEAGDCEHGTPGGMVPMPWVTGHPPSCPMCRRKRAEQRLSTSST